MKSRASIITIALLVATIVMLSAVVGCNIGAVTSQDEGLDAINEAWQIIFENYVDENKLDADKISQAAIQAMLEALDDPHTSYMDAETYQLSLSGIEGKFEGIGAQVNIEDEQLTIIAPIPGSPADMAGIRAGDIILGVDGKPTAEMSLAEAVLNVRGPLGTTVTLLVQHEGETEPVEIAIIRAEIDLPSVHYEMMDDIAYINITYFSDTTYDELYPVMEDVTQHTASGIILDLRSNPGGLLDAVVDVSGFFLDDGTVVLIVDNKGEQTYFTVDSADVTASTLPMVVLVDDYSASGSEVLTGALRDHDRAVIAGMTTYGKGSVNALYPLSDGSAIYLTTARWLTPSGQLIEGEGLHPDYELNLEEVDGIQWAIDYLMGNN